MSPSQSAPEIEIVSPALHVEWHDNRQLVIVRMIGASLNDVLTLGKTIKPIINEWPQEKPYLVIYDTVNWNAGSVTPAMRSTMLDLYNLAKGRNLVGRIGIVFHRTLLMAAFQFFLKINQPKGLPTNIFYTEAEALKWLRELEKDRINVDGA